MARKKKNDESVTATEVWPKVTEGSHSTRTEYEDGRVEFVTHWEALERDVRDAIRAYETTNFVGDLALGQRPKTRARKK